MATSKIKLCATFIFLATLQCLVGAEDQLVANLSAASSSFSQQFYRQVAASGANVVYSPYSIHSALTMTSTGARGDTLREMKTVLGLTSMSDASVLSAYHNLILQLNNVRNVKLDTANAIFANPNFKISDEFVNTIAAKYFATAANFDLSAQSGPEEAINQFVSLKTHKVITNVLAPGTIDANTLMILINTVFFNGTWDSPFAKYSTMKRDFFLSKDVKKQVDTMQDEKYLSYKRCAARKVDVVELPFKGRRFGLYLALPHDVEGISELEKQLDKDAAGTGTGAGAGVGTGGVHGLFQNMYRKRLVVAIPKFRIETNLNLKKTLMAMGMRTPFTAGQADFSGISQSGSFYLDEVIHKAVIDVQESGTVAAAVTAIRMVATSAVLSPPPDRFTADHPFMYFLRDKQTGQILFQGKFSG